MVSLVVVFIVVCVMYIVVVGSWCLLFCCSVFDVMCHLMLSC